ncbi:hypothetical protein M885DRAFT_504691 [Pelagophyceae sp. CCMP2097]|nr:hypothetical protein M885DRAFT_504691 [Pelagophyceae sp. CCMP2097]
MLLAVVGLSVAAAYSRPRIFFAPEHAGHGANGPERPQRLDDVCVPAVRGLGGAVEWTTVETPRADAEQAVRRVHDGAYVDMVKRRARSSLFGRQLLGPETFASFGSHAALLRAQSAWLEAVDSVLPVDAPGGRRVAWALTRPPGHHAGYSTAQGFCVYNFAAAACEHALEAGVDWCVVLDWDVHHGNGVADYVDAAALRGETRACYASTHEAALWPFTGDDAQDRGPRGNRFAAPVKRGAMLADYAEAWRACLDFAKAHVDKVGGTRGLVLVSAGFDALRTDSLAGCRLEPRDFAHLARDLATAFPDAPIVFGLEGGYSDDAGAALVAALEPFLGGDGALAADERVDERGDRGDGLVRLCDVPATDGFHRVSLPSRGSVVVCRDGDDFDVLPSRLPPFSLATHAYADFDRHLRCVVERSTRTKFYVESGAVRGTWSPALALTAGGGDAPSTRDGIKR